MKQLSVFARHWTPGKVKTRLSPSISPEAAAHVYRASLVVTLFRFARAADRSVLVYTPADERASFAEIATHRWTLEPQEGDDLGARLRNHFQKSFAAGAKQVVVIGSDSPTLPIEFATDALLALKRHDLVLGPADDGGYYLIGLSRPHWDLFDNIEWGSSHVRQQTLERAKSLRASVCELPPWYDFDTALDLQRLRAQVARLAPRESVYRPLAVALSKALPNAH